MHVTCVSTYLEEAGLHVPQAQSVENQANNVHDDHWSELLGCGEVQFRKINFVGPDCRRRMKEYDCNEHLKEEEEEREVGRRVEDCLVNEDHDEGGEHVEGDDAGDLHFGRLILLWLTHYWLSSCEE